jgi:hypothetical protein
MLGLGTAPGDDAGRAVRGDPLDLHVLQRGLDAVAEPLADPLRVTGDLQAGKGVLPVGAGRRVQLVGTLPLDEERQLGVGDQAVDADLLPLQLGAVGAVPVARSGLAAEPLLHLADVVDRDDPAEPAATGRGPGAHGLPERRLVGGRVVEHLDDLEVGVVGQGEHAVAGPEARVDAPVDELTPEHLADALGSPGESVRASGVGDVVQAHARILRQRLSPARQGVEFC